MTKNDALRALENLQSSPVGLAEIDKILAGCQTDEALDEAVITQILAVIKAEKESTITQIDGCKKILKNYEAFFAPIKNNYFKKFQVRQVKKQLGQTKIN